MQPATAAGMLHVTKGTAAGHVLIASMEHSWNLTKRRLNTKVTLDAIHVKSTQQNWQTWHWAVGISVIKHE
jgi:hypothetical protein